MPCTCRTDLEAKLLERFKQQHPDTKNHQLELTGYALVLGEQPQEYPAMKVIATHTVTSKAGRQREKKVIQSMIGHHCPFCGTPVTATPAAPPQQ